MSDLQDLVNLVGEKQAKDLMDVHPNTLYKWRDDISEKEQRKPSSTANRLAKIYMYLIAKCGWTIEEVRGAALDD